jgi:hypothetical protein
VPSVQTYCFVFSAFIIETLSGASLHCTAASLSAAPISRGAGGRQTKAARNRLPI